MAGTTFLDAIATPYITGGPALDRKACTTGRYDAPRPSCAPALVAALHALVSLRFFTGSHLSYHAKEEALHGTRLGRPRPDEEELLVRGRRTAVLRLPQDEPWEVISPPIRRLLFRHWYGSPGGAQGAPARP